MQVFIELFNFSFFSITGQGIDLDYLDNEWLALETKGDHSVIFEMFSLVLEKTEEPEVKLPTSVGSWKKAREFRKNIYF